MSMVINVTMVMGLRACGDRVIARKQIGPFCMALPSVGAQVVEDVTVLTSKHVHTGSDAYAAWELHM